MTAAARRCRPRLLLALLLALAAACDERAPPLIEGHPGGPYRMTLTLAPPQPQAGQLTQLTWHLTHAASGMPVQDLQVLHERVIHNFIVKRDFSSFAHIHHEDFRALTAADLAAGSFTLPYRFPSAGSYRVVSEFAHRDRGWSKHFDVDVGGPPPPPVPAVDRGRTRTVGAYHASLRVSPDPLVAGYESELVLELSRAGQPVTDLALYLGVEVHVALWRDDGSEFGHTHSYTPHMAAMLHAMHDADADPTAHARQLADMMVQMMNMPPELVFRGPRIPVHYVFPAPGLYHVFLQCAPGGTPQVFAFVLEVAAYAEGMQTRIESVLDSSAAMSPVP